MATKSTGCSNNVLNLESLANGNYLLEIKDQNRNLARKRIVKANR